MVDLHIPHHLQQRAHLIGLAQRLTAERAIERLWAGDASLWYPAPETQRKIEQRLGWLHAPAALTKTAAQAEQWLAQVRAAGCTDVLYISTGGSAFAARMWHALASDRSDALRLSWLDTVVPDDVATLLANIDWARTAVACVALAPSLELAALLDVVQTAHPL